MKEYPYRIICTDIDGTLLDSRRELSDRTIAAFRALPREVGVILASSRMPSAMRHLQQQLGILDHPLICYNGGYVIHYADDHTAPEVWTSVTIPVDTVKGIVAAAAGTSLHVSLYEADNWYAPADDAWTLRESTITKTNPIIRSNAAVLESWQSSGAPGAHKVMCMGPEAEIDALMHRLHIQYASDVHLYRSKSTYLEIAPRSISKASGLQCVLDRTGAGTLEQVVAFGDNYNDIDLLQHVGYGVAVDNARPEAKAVAREIAAHHREDGVAQVVERLFGLL